MGLRGAEIWALREEGDGCVPLEVIARHLGTSARNVSYIYARALNKLRASPEDLRALRMNVAAAAAFERDLRRLREAQALVARSLECRVANGDYMP